MIQSRKSLTDVALVQIFFLTPDIVMLTAKIRQCNDPDAGFGHSSLSWLWQSFYGKENSSVDTIVHAYDPSPREAKTGGLWQIGDKSCLDSEFQANQDYIVRSCLRTKPKQKKKGSAEWWPSTCH
jgi:hypothetical protein